MRLLVMFSRSYNLAKIIVDSMCNNRNTCLAQYICKKSKNFLTFPSPMFNVESL
jgi:hypothetical protein